MLANFPVGAALPAADIERAKKFYQEKLGFTDMKEDPGGVTFACGGGTSLYVYPSQFAGTNKATAAGWYVDDLDAEMKALRDNGVEFIDYDLPGMKTENGVFDYGEGRGAWFADSEGNILAINQQK